MQTQSDSKIRVVSLSNLEAMCQQVSGHCHTYRVSKVSRSRVHVEYSNPSEYGSPRPIYAIFPCYGENVVLDYLNVLEGNDKSLDGEGWQSFEVLRDAPVMFRSPEGKWSPFVPNPAYPLNSPKAYIPMLSACQCGHTAYSHSSLTGGLDSPPEGCHAFTGDGAPKCECKQFVSEGI
jgi:hypothetical protein